MNRPGNSNQIQMMVTIVDRGNQDRVVRILNEEKMHFHYLCFGLGTASSELLDYLGIGETKKSIILSLLSDAEVDGVQSLLASKFGFRGAGKGIVFTLPLSGIGSHLSKAICEECEMIEHGENTMETKTHDLVLAVVNQGYTSVVMDAAKKVGAMGGTIVHARGIQNEEAQKFMGISIQSEREIVFILVKKEDKAMVMHEISVHAGHTTEAGGIVLSLPVNSIIGLMDGVK